MAQGNLSDEEYFNKIRRRWEYKMPVARKYSIIAGCVTGFTHAMISKKGIRIFQHLCTVTPILFTGISYEDISVYLKYKDIYKDS